MIPVIDEKIEPFSKQQILDFFKQIEYADHNFKFVQNGRKYSKQVGNTVGKGEIARSEQFLVLSNFSVSHRVFKHLYCRHIKNKGLFGKGLRIVKIRNVPITNNKSDLCWYLSCKEKEIIVKEKIAGN